MPRASKRRRVATAKARPYDEVAHAAVAAVTAVTPSVPAAAVARLKQRPGRVISEPGEDEELGQQANHRDTIRQRIERIATQQATQEQKRVGSEVVGWWVEYLDSKFACQDDDCDSPTGHCWLDFDEMHHALTEQDIVWWASLIVHGIVEPPMPKLRSRPRKDSVSTKRLEVRAISRNSLEAK